MEKFKLQPTFANPLRSSISRRASGVIEKHVHNALDAKSLVINSNRQVNNRKTSVRMLFKMKKSSFLASSDSKENYNPKTDKIEKTQKPEVVGAGLTSNKPVNSQLKPAPKIAPVQTNKFVIDLIVFEEKLSKFYV